MISSVLTITIFTFYLIGVESSKLYTGQKVYIDTHMIDFADPAKHGFHVVLNEEFVNTHLQPIRLPTVFATAIALKQSQSPKRKNETILSAPSSAAALNDGLRVTKILYPENVNPDDGLLDGRTVKILGLRERTWYYVCVEFESNLNRHEAATGTSCQLKRTLDKFGKSVESTVSEVELSEITDRSVSVKLRVEIDFPIRLSIFLNQDRSGDGSKSVPAHTFVVDRSQTLNVIFGPFLEPDTSYGALCVLEEPLPSPTAAYTAMGRAVQATMQHCYFDDLKTHPAPLRMNSQERQVSKMPGHSKSIPQVAGKRALAKTSSSNFRNLSFSIFFVCSILSGTSLRRF